MFQLRFSHPAQADLEHIFAVSIERWGEDGKERYLELMAAAFRAIGTDPEGPMTRDRSPLGARIRSFHTRHARRGHGVQDPVHVIYYRAGRASIEVVRILHERMDPAAHLEPR
jgi:toxin ParE1/3/4